MNINRDPLKHFMKVGDLESILRRRLVYTSTGFPVDLTGASVQFILNEEDLSAKINKPAVIENPPTAGIVNYPWEAGDTDDAGNFPSEFEVTFASGKKATFPSGEFSPGKSYIYCKFTADLGD